jgi:hypothetical protein
MKIMASKEAHNAFFRAKNKDIGIHPELDSLHGQRESPLHSRLHVYIDLKFD